MSSDTKKINVLCIIQARLGSTRFPNKVMEWVGGKPMVKRVFDAAKGCKLIDKVIVAWPERYPDLDQNDVLERFRRIIKEFNAETIVRLTADCPLITAADIDEAFSHYAGFYYSNHYDGRDVQIFSKGYLFDPRYTHKEHVIADFTTQSTGLSVNTRLDLERVRKLC